MSNALQYILAVTTQPATQANNTPAPSSHFITSVAGVGLCVLVVWIIRRLMRPEKFHLRICPGRPSSLTPLHALGLIFVMWATGSLFYQVVFASLDEMKRMMLSSLAKWLVTVPVCLIVAHFTFRHGIIKGMGLTSRRWLIDSLRGIIAWLAVLPICLILQWLTVEGAALLFGDHISTPKHGLLQTMTSDNAMGWKVFAVALALIVAPFAEEIFFRGIFQSMFRKFFRSAWASILFTSVLFSLMHFQYWHTLPALFALSIVLGYNYERSGRLWAPILIHLLFNATFTIAELLQNV